jgi:uncharacterized protein YecE (DUF72 family)
MTTGSAKHLHYFSGLSGLQLPVPKYLFPPEHQASSRLQYYATFFNSIEINSTFYKLPLGTTLTKWSESVGDSFKFTFKLWKQITHNEGLNFDPADAREFLSIVSNVGVKKGCLLIQFPPSIKISSISQLAKLLALIRGSMQDSWSIAVEFRDLSWYHEDVYAVMKLYKASIVIHDKSKYPSPFLDELSDTLYVRFHGPSGDYRGSYTDDFLSEYSSYIKKWLSDGKTVYTYFNNTMGDAFNNLIALNKFLGIV